jgi:hypothetical protein
VKQVTHALTMNGRIHGELKDPLDTPEETIGKRLALLDATRRYSLSLWRLPTGVAFDRVDLVNWPQEYIQAAGSRDRMVVEVRRLEGDAPRQYAVGRAVREGQPAIEETVVPWDRYEARVPASEVFRADEAATLFVAYYRASSLPETVALRALDLSG